MKATDKIDHYVASLSGWKRELVIAIRALVLESANEVVEEWKWNSPVWSCNGPVCSVSAFKNHVGLSFFNGAALDVENGVFNGGLESKKSRSINFKEGDHLNKAALKALLKKAVRYNNLLKNIL